MYNRKNIIYKTGMFLTVVAMLTSCVVTKKYSTPKITESNVLFRLDSLSKNGKLIENQEWKTFFKDDFLKRYIDTALVYNQDNQVAFKNIEIFKAQFKQGQFGYLPTATVEGNVQRSKQVNSSTTTQYQVNTNLAWEADLWGKITSQKLVAKAEFSKSVTAQKLLQTQLVANIATTYYRLLEADKRKDILEKTVVVRKQSVQTLQSLKEAGQGNILAVNQAESQLMQAEILLTSVKNEIFTLENALIGLIGKPMQSIERKTIDEQVIDNSYSIGVPLEVLANRPDVKEAELNIRSSFENYNVAKTSMYPTIRLTANIGTQSSNISNLFSANSFFNTFIGGVTSPIFNGRQLRTRKEVSKLQMEQNILRFQKTVLNASLEVSNTLQNVKTSSKNVEALTNQETLLSRSFEDSKELLNAGFANYLDVLNAQSNLLNVQLQRANTQLQQLESITVLYRTLGGGVN